MSPDKEKKLLSESKEALVSRIDQLEQQLERISAQRDEAYAIAQEVSKRNMGYEAENKEVKQRIKELEDPHDRHSSGIGWLGKVVHIIRQRGRPMRAQEIIHELKAMDTGRMLRFVDDPDKHLSIVLAKGKKAGRLRLFKVAGTRGGYYALEDWVDDNGNLNSEMKVHLL